MVTQRSNQDTNSGLSNAIMCSQLVLAYYFVAQKLEPFFLSVYLLLRNALIIAFEELVHINE